LLLRVRLNLLMAERNANSSLYGPKFGSSGARAENKAQSKQRAALKLENQKRQPTGKDERPFITGSKKSVQPASKDMDKHGRQG